VDQGGPRRELLQLLTDQLASVSPVFIGSPDAKHMNVVSHGNCVTLWYSNTSLTKWYEDK